MASFALLAACRTAPEVTYTRDVAPILFTNCAPCHRPGEVAPFPLLTWEDARKRASQIAAVTERRFMPPWLPEPGHGRFAGERRLSEAEIATLAAWAQGGAPEGDPADLPERPRWASGWQLGEPDLVVEMEEPFELPAEGPDVFRNFVLPVPVERPRWVRTLEFRSDNPPVVHHVILQVDDTGAARRRDAEAPGPGFGGMDLSDSHRPDGIFLGWTPGRVPDPGSDDIAWRLEPGTDLVVQLHMPPTGKPEKVRIKVGLFFAEAAPTLHPFSLLLGSEEIDIPAGEKAYPLSDRFRLPVDVEVLSLYPHAHYLGDRMEVSATLPDGGEKVLLRIDDWDFNWQDEYRFAEPVRLPAGTEVRMEYTYDNSAENPQNPHLPPRRVRYGYESADEMGYLLLRVLPASGTDRTRLEIAQLRHTLESKPGQWRARAGLSRLLLARGDLPGAVAELRRALEDAPQEALLLTLLGQALGRSGRMAEALPLLEEAVRRDPELTVARINLGVAYEIGGRRADAAREYRRALELSPASPQAHLNLARLEAAQGRLGVAEDHLRRALETLDPASDLARLIRRQLGRLGAAATAPGQG